MKSGFALHEIITDEKGIPVDFIYIDTNRAFEQLTGLSAADIIGKKAREVIPSMDPETLKSYGGVALGNGTISFERYDAHFKKYFDITAYSPAPGFFAVIVNDITQFKRTEEELRTERDFIKNLMEIMPIGVAVLDKEEKITFCNKRAEEILESKGTGEDKPYYDAAGWMHCDMNGNPVSHEDLPVHKAFTIRQPVKNVRYGLFNENGRRKFLSVNATPVLDLGGNPVQVITAFEDISEQSANEQTIAQALKEKETMLKEIHHRVKNNFQVISSLINLQLSRSDLAGSETHLRGTKTRIRAMALVHEKLYQTKSLSSIDLSEYIRALTRDIELSMRALPRKPRIEYTLTPVLLDIERAVPCGLIVNEIITNAFRHAFPTEFDGNPVIRISIEHDEHTVLSISDNGVGIDRPLDFSSSDTLGISLIGMLAKQLRADLEVSSTGGVSYTIRLS
jgi:PAS domain S-box-containing protein